MCAAVPEAHSGNQLDIRPRRELQPPKPSGSELHPNAAIDHTAVKRRPRVHSPATIRTRRRQDKRVISRLPDVEQVLAVEEQPETTDLPLAKRANQDIWPARRAVRILFERLSAGIVAFKSQATPAL